MATSAMSQVSTQSTSSGVCQSGSQVLLTDYLRCLPAEVRTKLVDKAYVEQHTFASFSKKALDIEAKLGSAHKVSHDGRKRLPQDWKKKGQLMFVDHDGQTTEIDDFPDLGELTEQDGASETSDGGVVAPIKEKARGTEKKKVGRSTGQGDHGTPAWVKLGLDYEVWRDRVARGTCRNYGNYGHTSNNCRGKKVTTKVASPTVVGVLLRAAHRETPRASRSVRVSMDFMDTLVTSKSGNRHIFVIVDRFTKCARLIAMPETAKIDYVIKLFMDNWVRDFGLPTSIVSDRDVRFTSELWQSTAEQMGTKLQMTSGNHLESNGQAEQMNRVVQHLLRHYIKPSQDDWDEKLPLVASLYNNAVHSTTGMTPNQLHLGWKPRSALDFLLPERHSTAAPGSIEFAVQYEQMLQQAVEHIRKSQDAMIASENKHKRPLTFRRATAPAAANHNKARKDAASVLMQQEATHTAALQAWHVDPEETTEPTTKHQTKSALASMMHQVILTCNWQQVEQARQARTITEYEETLKSLHARLDMLKKDDVLHRHTASSSTDPSIRELEGRLDHLVALVGDLNSFRQPTTIRQQISALQADLRQLQQQPTGTCNSVTPKQFKMLKFSIERFDDYHKAAPISWWQGFTNELSIHLVPPESKISALYRCSTAASQSQRPSATTQEEEEEEEEEEDEEAEICINNGSRTTERAMEEVQPHGGAIQTPLEVEQLQLVQQHQAHDVTMPRQRQRRCSSTTKLGKLSSAGSEATPLPTPPDTIALQTTSSASEEHAYVASLHEDYEDHAVQLVPPLDQPLHVQDTFACATSSPSPSKPASSPTSLGDASVLSRLEELDPLTPEDFQWLPLPPSGSLPKPHCNALMAELRNYLHAAVPAPLMEDGVAVVDLREYIAKIDHEYATHRYDDTGAPLLYVRIQIRKAACSTLIDCGATRNYISQDFMTHADLGPRVRRKSQSTQVTLADGSTHKSIDRCIDSVPVYFTPLAREAVSFDILDTQFDMILGMSWLRSEDHPVNFYRCTVHVRDWNGVLVPCTVPPPHPSIGYHVVSAASIYNSIAWNDVEEMGIYFLHALPPADEPAAEQPPDPRIEELEVLRTQLDDLIDKGWIRPSCSPYGAPVLFVRKKNKELRLCIDYRKLNAQTIKNVGLLPRIDDLLERFGGAKYFSKLDLKSAYHQLEIHPRDRYKTAFKTRYVHFEWVVMPFGLTNAPTTFQAAMTTEFRDMLDRFVLIYLDDILVYSRTLDEHIGHLRVVLDRLRTTKYKANRAKCEFAQQELEYLGHFVTPQGISPLADKIKAIQDWPEPTNTMEVRSFMGLVGYYQRFIG
ncbi:hypothetical protein CBR_g4215 [Chara braunii]|uniref:Reverse transcriptase n=1 Tax=Chara braunii TaxID=69332 RepID=A0A388JRD1_CHABU|nr:hypothetical protein CBR_g4215 [Chara braunii]|eukprot:GBG60262.1 hypothetical protein CBR_g4215 [Chara braunii]